MPQPKTYSPAQQQTLALAAAYEAMANALRDWANLGPDDDTDAANDALIAAENHLNHLRSLVD